MRNRPNRNRPNRKCSRPMPCPGQCLFAGRSRCASSDPRHAPVANYDKQVHAKAKKSLKFHKERFKNFVKMFTIFFIFWKNVRISFSGSGFFDKREKTMVQEQN